MKHNRNGRRSGPAWQRRGVSHIDLLGDLPSYSSLNLATGEVKRCVDQTHACRSAFGSNKRNGNRNCAACVRGDGYFVMI